jgi:glycosyltransferase involved in cell wall biosynthesis
VNFHGMVDDLSGYYHAASIVLNTPIFGSGLKIKAIEAFRYGKCLLSTPVGAQGFEADAGKAYYLAEVEDLADACCMLLEENDLRLKYEQGAGELYASRFTPEVCYRDLLDLLQRC